MIFPEAWMTRDKELKRKNSGDRNLACSKVLKRAGIMWARDVARWNQRHGWEAKHWAITCEAMLEECGCYSKGNKKLGGVFRKGMILSDYYSTNNNLGKLLNYYPTNNISSWKLCWEGFRMEEPERKQE